jgi:uncharacterized protein DUF6705
MKIFKIIIFLAIFSSNFVYGQKEQATPSVDVTDLKHSESIKGNNVNINDSSLDKYVGTWTWKSGTKSLTVTFNKKLVHYGGNNNVLDVTILIGTYQYSNNGKEISSSSDNFLSGSSGGKSDTINLFISNNLRKTTVALLVLYLNSNSIQLELDNKRFESKNDKNFEFPSPVILTKQK